MEWRRRSASAVGSILVRVWRDGVPSSTAALDLFEVFCAPCGYADWFFGDRVALLPPRIGVVQAQLRRRRVVAVRLWAADAAGGVS